MTKAKKAKSLPMTRPGCTEQEMSESNLKQHIAVTNDFTPRTTQKSKNKSILSEIVSRSTHT